MSYPFDTMAPALPQKEIATLIGLLRGSGVQTSEDARCVLAVVCYGTYQFLPPTGPKALAAVTREEAADHLASLGKAKTVASTLPWSQIVDILIALYQAWKNQQGAA